MREGVVKMGTFGVKRASDEPFCPSILYSTVPSWRQKGNRSLPRFRFAPKMADFGHSQPIPKLDRFNETEV